MKKKIIRKKKYSKSSIAKNAFVTDAAFNIELHSRKFIVPEHQ